MGGKEQFFSKKSGWMVPDAGTQEKYWYPASTSSDSSRGNQLCLPATSFPETQISEALLLCIGVRGTLDQRQNSGTHILLLLLASSVSSEQGTYPFSAFICPNREVFSSARWMISRVNLMLCSYHRKQKTKVTRKLWEALGMSVTLTVMMVLVHIQILKSYILDISSSLYINYTSIKFFFFNKGEEGLSQWSNG